MYSCATLRGVIVVVVRMKCACLLTKPTTFMITLYPWASGSSTMKSTEMVGLGLEVAPIHPLVAIVVPLSLDIGHRSSHTDQCIETSVATSSSETSAQESSTFLYVWLFGCHDAETQSNIGVLGLGECRPSHRSGGDCLALTILLTGWIWSSPFRVPPLL